MPVDLLMGQPPTDGSGIVDQLAYVEELQQRMETVHQFARQHITHETKRQKRYYDHRGVRCNRFNRGDAVWLHNPKKKEGRSPKLQNNVFEGPFLIISRLDDVTYRIQKGVKTKPKVVHHNRLKPYEGTNIPTWLVDKSTEETTVSAKNDKVDDRPLADRANSGPTQESVSRQPRNRKAPAWLKDYDTN